jgi:hypothetical protein
VQALPAGSWTPYRRNPVFQNAHNYGDILFTLGKALITDVRPVTGRQALFQRIQLAMVPGDRGEEKHR